MLVLTVFPSATRTSLFSDAITYRFRVRPMTIACVGAAPAYVVGADEHAFGFTFAASSAGNDTDAPVQVGRCTARGRGRLSFKPRDTKANQGQNVLSIVLDMDAATASALGGPLLAVVSET